MLGLALNQQAWTLCYLWYNPADNIAKQHVEEIEEFVKAIGPDSVHFNALTYQELFRRLSEVVGHEHGHYMTYLSERYFPDVAIYKTLS
jgi:predicted SprT family Zn-dependent metalloprotease